MKFAAIDIGSNGARLLISSVLIQKSEKISFSEQFSLKDVEYTRFALRLGEDVFTHQRISEAKKIKLHKLMLAFKLLMELHEVEDYMALATSAFREAENRNEIVAYIQSEIGLDIQVIDGSKEAEILHRSIFKLLEEEKNYLHIDVGGGSTELNFYINREKVAAKSFPLGSIRNTNQKDSDENFGLINHWIETFILPHTRKQKLIAIGTGGNINKIANFIDEGEPKRINTSDIITLIRYLSGFSYDDLVNLVKLNPDRADTIVPASNIYLSVMQWAGATEMIVPKLGLKDGMMELMLQRNLEKIQQKEGGLVRFF